MSSQGIRVFGFASLLILLAVSAFAVLMDLAVGLAIVYAGIAVFCFSDYAAWRISEKPEKQWSLPPRIALLGFFGSVGLALTMLIAAFQV